MTSDGNWSNFQLQSWNKYTKDNKNKTTSRYSYIIPTMRERHAANADRRWRRNYLTNRSLMSHIFFTYKSVWQKRGAGLHWCVYFWLDAINFETVVTWHIQHALHNNVWPCDVTWCHMSWTTLEQVIVYDWLHKVIPGLIHHFDIRQRTRTVMTIQWYCWTP